MNKLLRRFQEEQTVEAARKVLAYDRKHPMAACMLDREQHELLKFAQVVVSNAA
jgi:hypothetical protein